MLYDTMDQLEGYYEIGGWLAKYIKGELSAAEEKQLMDWVDASAANRLLFEKLTQVEQISEHLQSYAHVDRATSWSNLQARIEASQQKRRVTLSRFYKYAAAVLLIILPLGFITYNYLTSDSSVLTAESEVIIPPGKDRATLELPNGQVVDLERATLKHTEIVEGVSLRQDKSGRLIYDLNDAAVKLGNNQKSVYHTIRTPKGGNYKVILADGTQVWLNALSSLRFPTHFDADTREVELSGEAYFEVAKDKSKPFIVGAKNTKVEVLGTQFNMTADTELSTVYTTLLEGAVKVIQGNNIKTLIPGQQAITNGNKLLVRSVDTDPIVAWKDGYFVFRSTSIHNMMTSISKWYDVEVDYVGNIEEVKFGGKFSKNTSLQELLKSLELTGTVRFKVEGRRVTVMP